MLLCCPRITAWVRDQRCGLMQVAACMGKEGDATPFTSVTVDNISAALHRWGLTLDAAFCHFSTAMPTEGCFAHRILIECRPPVPPSRLCACAAGAGTRAVAGR